MAIFGQPNFISGVGAAISGKGLKPRGGEPRWHQLTHLKEDADSHEFEDPNNASNFSDADHSEVNRKRLKTQMKIAMMDKANIPVWMIEKSISEQESNLENAG